MYVGLIRDCPAVNLSPSEDGPFQLQQVAMTGDNRAYKLFAKQYYIVDDSEK